MALTVEEIRGLYREHGHVAYSGEPVTQLEHALQSALLAEEAGADEALVASAFLHDLGHLLNRQGETPSARGIDDLHQYYVLPFLRPLFSDAV
uniref:HD domain-containing protein n=2 Tax=Pseudomonadota TaxID=1224 RepID=UPI001CA3C148